MDKKQRQKSVKRLWGNNTPKEIARQLKVSVRTIQRDVLELGLHHEDPPSVQERVDEFRARASETKAKRNERAMAERIQQLEDELEIALRCRDFRSHYTINSPPSVDTQAVAFMVASDWHIEEIVHKWQVNALNSFNEGVAKERINRFFVHGAKLVQRMQDHTNIDTLVLALLGDFISGSIHDELMEGNRLLPADAIMEAKQHLSSGIRYILENTDVKLVIPCSMGNHGRMTAKRRISTEAGNSLERVMYFALADEFKSEPRVHFIIGSGYHTYLYLFDGKYTVRFHHGHSIRFYGGVGGISIPVNKAIAQWNKARRADLDVFGHFHQFLDGGDWVTNGSLIGYNAFALSIKASPEPPRQAFFLIDRDVGKTIVTPIILERER